MGISILIVEDEPGTRNIIRRWLDRDGHTVFEAGSALEAIGIIERHHIDLAFIDFELGTTLTGLDVALHTKRCTYLVMITGHDVVAMQPKFEDPLKRFKAILGKPLELAHLSVIVGQVEKSLEDTAP